MKRIDLLKGIEQILVQKNYETGHINHRADGGWQKTNNGCICVKGGLAQPTLQAYRTIKGMAINNHILKATNHPLDTVNKSYRDMRSIFITKNMGFK